MTDPTTRYPLPDDPGQDPLAAPGPAAGEVPAPSAAATSAATGDPPAAREGMFGAPPPPPSPPPAAPSWTPPHDDGTRWPAIAFGLILLLVGLWLFADVTLGLDLPTIRWGQLWPIALIVVGALILYGSRLGRRR